MVLTEQIVAFTLIDLENLCDELLKQQTITSCDYANIQSFIDKVNKEYGLVKVE